MLCSHNDGNIMALMLSPEDNVSPYFYDISKKYFEKFELGSLENTNFKKITCTLENVYLLDEYGSIYWCKYNELSNIKIINDRKYTYISAHQTYIVGLCENSNVHIWQQNSNDILLNKEPPNSVEFTYCEIYCWEFPIIALIDYDKNAWISQFSFFDKNMTFDKLPDSENSDQIRIGYNELVLMSQNKEIKVWRPKEIISKNFQYDIIKIPMGNVFKLNNFKDVIYIILDNGYLYRIYDTDNYYRNIKIDDELIQDIIDDNYSDIIINYKFEFFINEKSFRSDIFKIEPMKRIDGNISKLFFPLKKSIKSAKKIY